MLRVYPQLLKLVQSVTPLICQLELHDTDLARQCRRALASVPLNIAEGGYSRGGNRKVRYHTALGSLREALACFEVATAFGHLPPLQPQLRREFDQIIGALVRVTLR